MLKWLLTIAVIVILLGLLTPRLRGRGPLRRLPGDITLNIRGRDHFFPFTTTILLSLVFYVLIRLF
ncbi:MAG: DUF2905 family protein [Rhodocyclaceae bacterium]|jgi:hypothetical protein|nr:DUF2905 family protein [Rhodocyclaceae bacterium]